MQQAVEKWLDILELGYGQKLERNNHHFGKDYRSRNQTRGLMWDLKDGSKLIDLSHVCGSKVMHISNFNAKVRDPDELRGEKVSKVYYIGEYPKFILRSGDPGYYAERFFEKLYDRGILPYPDLTYQGREVVVDGELKPIREINPEGIGKPMYLGIDYVYYLQVDLKRKVHVYDHNTYVIKCHVQNICSDKSVENLTKKDLLHAKLKGTGYIAKTWYINEFKYNSGYYVLRPSHALAFAGDFVYFVGCEREFNEAAATLEAQKRDYERNKKPSMRRYEIIVSEYIENPVLWEGRKSHLRLYGVVTTDRQKFKISRFGKIMTAALPFELRFDKSQIDAKEGNSLIHDTHLGSSPRDLWYPQDFERPDLIEGINKQLDELEKVLGGICSPQPYEMADKAYMVFGIDFMVRTTGEVVLIEINHKVGMNSKDPEAEDVKEFGRTFDKWKWKHIRYLFD